MCKQTNKWQNLDWSKCFYNNRLTITISVFFNGFMSKYIHIFGYNVSALQAPLLHALHMVNWLRQPFTHLKMYLTSLMDACKLLKQLRLSFDNCILLKCWNASLSDWSDLSAYKVLISHHSSYLQTCLALSGNYCFRNIRSFAS